MSVSRRKFTKEFKLAAVRRLETGASMAEVARACEVNPNVLHRWRREFRDGVDRAFSGARQAQGRGESACRTGAQNRPADPGDRFFKACLAASRGSADAASPGPNRAIYEQIEKETKREEAMTILHMCKAAEVSRVGFYRCRQEPTAQERDIDLRDEIQKIALEFPCSVGEGRRRVEAARLEGQPQAGPSHYARGQFTVSATAEVCGDY
jgi:transposase-like protein